MKLIENLVVHFDIHFFQNIFYHNKPKQEIKLENARQFGRNDSLLLLPVSVWCFLLFGQLSKLITRRSHPWSG